MDQQKSPLHPKNSQYDLTGQICHLELLGHQQLGIFPVNESLLEFRLVVINVCSLSLVTIQVSISYSTAAYWNRFYKNRPFHTVFVSPTVVLASSMCTLYGTSDNHAICLLAWIISWTHSIISGHNLHRLSLADLIHWL